MFERRLGFDLLYDSKADLWDDYLVDDSEYAQVRTPEARVLIVMRVLIVEETATVLRTLARRSREQGE